MTYLSPRPSSKQPTVTNLGNAPQATASASAAPVMPDDWWTQVRQGLYTHGFVADWSMQETMAMAQTCAAPNPTFEVCLECP